MEYRWFVNGCEIESLPLDDRGLAYGDGLFETMRAIGSEIPLGDFHQARLLSGCERLGINLDKNQFNQQIDQVLNLVQNPQSVIKAIVTRGGVASGYAQEQEIEPNIYIRISALNSASKPDQQIQPIDAQLCNTRLSIQPRLAGIKHLNRLEQVMAAAEMEASACAVEEGILLDTDGNVVEAISSNLIAVIEGVLHFPDLSAAGVKGVMQTYIAKLCASESIELKVSKMTFDELCQATEILVCNSVRGVRNISAIEDNWHSCESSGMQFGIQLRQLLKEKLNNEFYSF